MMVVGTCDNRGDGHVTGQDPGWTGPVVRGSGGS